MDIPLFKRKKEKNEEAVNEFVGYIGDIGVVCEIPSVYLVEGDSVERAQRYLNRFVLDLEITRVSDQQTYAAFDRWFMFEMTSLLMAKYNDSYSGYASYGNPNLLSEEYGYSLKDVFDRALALLLLLRGYSINDACDLDHIRDYDYVPSMSCMLDDIYMYFKDYPSLQKNMIDDGKVLMIRRALPYLFEGSFLPISEEPYA